MPCDKRLTLKSGKDSTHLRAVESRMWSCSAALCNNMPLHRFPTMFSTAVRYFSKKPKPKMKPIELNTPPEQTQTITRVIFDILKDHGPLTVAETWDRVKEVGLRGLSSKRHMKIVLRWMRERQKVRTICNHVGSQKQFLYTTWFTKPSITNIPRQANHQSPRPKLP